MSICFALKSTQNKWLKTLIAALKCSLQRNLRTWKDLLQVKRELTAKCTANRLTIRTQFLKWKLFYSRKLHGFWLNWKFWQISCSMNVSQKSFERMKQQEKHKKKKMSNANKAKYKTIKRTKLPGKKQKTNILLIWRWILLRFYCMAQTNGHLHVRPLSFSSTVSFHFLRFFFLSLSSSLVLFVHRHFVCSRLNYADCIKDECYMAPFDAQQGLFLRWCPPNIAAIVSLSIQLTIILPFRSRSLTHSLAHPSSRSRLFLIIFVLNK